MKKNDGHQVFGTKISCKMKCDEAKVIEKTDPSRAV